MQPSRLRRVDLPEALGRCSVTAMALVVAAVGLSRLSRVCHQVLLA
jgi:hypothetical protein